MLPQLPAIDDLAFNIHAAHANDSQLDQAITKQNASTRLDLPSQPLKGGGNQARRAFDVARRDRNLRSRPQRDRSSALQAAGANLGALQVLQYADGTIFQFSRAAQALDNSSVFLVRSMGEVQAGDVHAEPHKIAQHGFGVASRPHGADNFGAPQVGSRLQRVYRRIGALRRRLSLFQFWSIQDLFRSIYCIWRKSPRRTGTCTNGRVHFYSHGCPVQASLGGSFIASTN